MYKMKTIYYLFGVVLTMLCCTSCNNEWEDEQYVQMASFKANVNAQGVTTTYLRYKPNGTVQYDLPVIISGSTMNTENRTIHIGLDPDTLATLNIDQYGHREELYFLQLKQKYYSMPETVDIPAGECTANIPIEFKLGDLDQSDKWVLPLKILSDPTYNYQVNPNKYYSRAMLRILPFNDYSGTYDASQYKIYLEPDPNRESPFTISSTRAFVVNENTIFIYAGSRDIDYLDRKQYKIFIRFTDEEYRFGKKLEIYTDNPEIGLTLNDQAYYMMDEEMDELKPYLKKVYINLMNINYSFDDITTIPGEKMHYTVEGSLSLQRNLNTLIPDEDQQVQW